MTSQETRILRQMLSRTLDQLQVQENLVVKLADEFGCEPHEVRSADGTYMLTELLHSKALILNAFALTQGN